MLVHDMFEGDDLRLARRQHDVYGTSLGILLEECRRHFLAACLIGGGDRDRWPHDAQVDHRDVQRAHDILAGAWRWRASPPERLLPLDRPADPPADVPDWLTWLRSEVASWWSEPDLILSVVAIVTRPGPSIAYAGSIRLCGALLLRFMAVPWRVFLLERD